MNPTCIVPTYRVSIPDGCRYRCTVAMRRVSPDPTGRTHSVRGSDWQTTCSLPFPSCDAISHEMCGTDGTTAGSGILSAQAPEAMLSRTAHPILHTGSLTRRSLITALPMHPKVWCPNLEGHDRHYEEGEHHNEGGTPIPLTLVLFWFAHRWISAWFVRGVSVGMPWSP